VKLCTTDVACAHRRATHIVCAYSRCHARQNCSLIGSDGRYNSGPLSAERVVDRLNGAEDGEVLGIDVKVTCPWPELDEIMRITGHDGSTQTASLEVSVQHLGVPLPFQGVPGGNVIQVRDLPLPPISPPPSTPPAPLTPPARGSCKEILGGNPSATSGTYTIEVLGQEVEVYCNMDMSGGGWTLVVEISGSNRNHVNPAQVGTMPLTEGGNRGAKLSDAMINALKTEAYVFMCGGCAAFMEPINFRSDSNQDCGGGNAANTHGCVSCGGNTCEDNTLSCSNGVCSFSSGGYCGSGGSYDTGMSTWPSMCSCNSQYNADGQNGCYQGAYSNQGFVYAR
jgi:hypothetical protein